jgi:hypothetical protein
LFLLTGHLFVALLGRRPDLRAIFSTPQVGHHQRRLGVVFIDIVLGRIIDIPTKELPSDPFAYRSLGPPI